MANDFQAELPRLPLPIPTEPMESAEDNPFRKSTSLLVGQAIVWIVPLLLLASIAGLILYALHEFSRTMDEFGH